jgi:hypothetical protein
VNVLEEAGGYDAYLGPRFRRVAPTERAPDESFEQFVSRMGIGAVVIDPALRAHRRFADDPEFAAFVRDPPSLGFEAFELAPGGCTLAVGWDAASPHPMGARTEAAERRAPAAPRL